MPQYPAKIRAAESDGHDGLMVFQFRIAAEVDAVPITRDYPGSEEAKIACRLAPDTARPIAMMPTNADVR